MRVIQVIKYYIRRTPVNYTNTTLARWKTVKYSWSHSTLSLSLCLLYQAQVRWRQWGRVYSWRRLAGPLGETSQPASQHVIITTSYTITTSQLTATVPWHNLLPGKMPTPGSLSTYTRWDEHYNQCEMCTATEHIELPSWWVPPTKGTQQKSFCAIWTSLRSHWYQLIQTLNQLVFIYIS